VEKRDLAFVVSACGGELLQGEQNTQVHRVCTDSRAAQAGDLFVALVGEKFDGHDYLYEVAEKGAVALVVESERSRAKLPSLASVVVDDTRMALGRIGAAYRRDFSLPVIAVAGSNGKTSTKELIAAVLREKLATLWSESSFNNDIGVPMTLLRLEQSHQAAVFEVGTNHPGELAPLVKMIAPKYGVITTIGREHLEFFGDMAGVAREEGMLAELLPAGGKLFLNGDNEWTDEISKRTRATVVLVGTSARCDWRARNIKLDKKGTTFTVEAPDETFSGSYRINLLGRHQVANALFAIALGAEMGLDCEEIRHGLGGCAAAKMRLEIWESSGVCVLDDAYNANADSMLAALQVLQELPCKGRRVAVLGDMAELGDQSESAHAEVGRCAVELGVEQLIAVGTMAGVMATAARGAGLSRVIELVDAAAAATAIKSFLRPGDTVLLKASRASRLERISAALRGTNGMGKH